MHDPLSIQHSLALRIVKRLPRPLLLAPEQIVLNFAFMLIGIAGFFPEGGSLIAEWLPWVTVSWALAMSAGGFSVLFGLFRNNSTIERMGYLLLAPACLLFAWSALYYRGWPGISTCLIFLAMSSIKTLRLIITAANRDTWLELGQKMDRDTE